LDNLIEDHFEELLQEYPDLKLLGDEKGQRAVEGVIDREATFKDVTLRLTFQVRVNIPEQYPDPCFPPVAFETGGIIPRTADDHIYPNGSLCLAAPISVKMKFAQAPTLLGFMNILVIPFLYAFRHKQEYGQMPFGERSHGVDGIMEHYREYLDVSDDIALISLVRVLADEDYRGHHDCPCGSGKKLRNCHGSRLLEIKKYHSQEVLLTEYGEMLLKLHKSGMKLPRNALSKVFAKTYLKK